MLLKGIEFGFGLFLAGAGLWIAGWILVVVVAMRCK